MWCTSCSSSNADNIIWLFVVVCTYKDSKWPETNLHYISWFDLWVSSVDVIFMTRAASVVSVYACLVYQQYLLSRIPEQPTLGANPHPASTMQVLPTLLALGKLIANNLSWIGFSFCNADTIMDTNTTDPNSGFFLHAFRILYNPFLVLLHFYFHSSAFFIRFQGEFQMNFKI